MGLLILWLWNVVATVVLVRRCKVVVAVIKTGEIAGGLDGLAGEPGRMDSL